MPSPRDITGDLVRLRHRRSLATDNGNPSVAAARMRPMALDPVLWVSGGVILLGLALEAAFILWMW